MSDEKKTPEAKPKARRVYQAPAFESEETFEREAVLGCGKMSGFGGACFITPKAS